MAARSIALSAGTHVMSGELTELASAVSPGVMIRPRAAGVPRGHLRHPPSRGALGSVRRSCDHWQQPPLRPVGLRPLAITAKIAAEHCAIQKHPSLVPVGGDSDMQHRPSGVEPGSARALSGQSPVHTVGSHFQLPLSPSRKTRPPGVACDRDLARLGRLQGPESPTGQL